MEAIAINVTGSTAGVTKGYPIVAGTKGLPVEFTFDETWASLEKMAVFRANEKTYDQLLPGSRTTVPWELLEKPGCCLWCGVYGTAEDGKLQLPTVWVELGKIQPGADPSGDLSADPTMPVWQQLTKDVEEALDAILRMENDIISGVIKPASEGGNPL